MVISRHLPMPGSPRGSSCLPRVFVAAPEHQLFPFGLNNECGYKFFSMGKVACLGPSVEMWKGFGSNFFFLFGILFKEIIAPWARAEAWKILSQKVDAL